MTDLTAKGATTKVGIFGKGGSGKSTLTVYLARAFCRDGYLVTVLDADSTNVGTHDALGIKTPPAPLLEYFGGAVFRGGTVTCPVDDPTRLPSPTLDWAALPDCYKAASPEGIRYLSGGKIGDQGIGAGCDGPIAKIARDVTLANNGEHQVLLVDFKAGFEDSARGVITGIDCAVVVTDPTNAGLQIVKDMAGMLRSMQAGALPATEHLERPDQVEFVRQLFKNARVLGPFVVLNRIDSPGTEDFLRHGLDTVGIAPDAVLPASSEVAAAWLRGNPLPQDDSIYKEMGVLAGKLIR